jgi:hypothetical protein
MRLTFSRPWSRGLPCTLFSTALLLVVPTALLIAFPRRSATGLERLLPSATLLQSFPVQPSASPPALWTQRLGSGAAARYWTAQRHLWWQFWGAHSDAGAYLAMRAPANLPIPAHGLRVDDLMVVAPDPLARQLLQQELKVRRRPPRGLALRCIQQLRQGQAVHWSAGALAQLLGPLTLFTQDLEQGCLQVSSQGKVLRWTGEADAHEGALVALPPPPPAPQPLPLDQNNWFELRGRKLDLLLRGVVTSPILRQSLQQTYGLKPATLRELQAMPFRLRLWPVARGSFQAGVSLELQVGQERGVIEAWLTDLSTALREQSLSDTVAGPGLTLWSPDAGAAVGGWRWLPRSRQLELFLGPVPSSQPPSPPLVDASWRLRLRPFAMAQGGVLPPRLPAVVRRSQQLMLEGRAVGERSGERQSSLAGQLELR